MEMDMFTSKEESQYLLRVYCVCSTVTGYFAYHLIPIKMFPSKYYFHFQMARKGI
jgi:hypothetical protein